MDDYFKKLINYVRHPTEKFIPAPRYPGKKPGGIIECALELVQWQRKSS